MKTKLLFLSLAINGFIYAQAPIWTWAKSTGGNSNDQISNIATDNNGNIYATGLFGSPTISLGTTTLTNTGTGNEIFVTKYNPSGNAVWARSASGRSDDWSNDVATDPSGNIYITGVFTSDTVTFGSTMLFNAVSSQFSPKNDLFIAKYDSSGNLLWAKGVGGNGDDVGYSIAADNSGNLYVTGYFSSDTLAFGSTKLINAGGNSGDFFTAKFDALTGSPVWAKSVGGTSYDSGESIAIDISGNIYVTGTFRSASVTFGTTTLTNSGTNNAYFIAKYNTSGNVVWANGSGGSFSDFGDAITTDPSGNIYVTGQFNSATFTLGTYTLTNTAAGASDIFIAKYNTSGTVLWAKNAGGGNNDYGSGIAPDALGNVYITGAFWSPTVTFGLTNLTKTGAGDDFFVAKYDGSSGNVLWAISAGGSKDDYGQSITVDASGNTYVGGFFYSTSLALGTTTLSNPAGGSGGYTDLFIGKLGSTLIGIEETDKSTDISVYPNPGSGQFIIRLNNYSNVSVLDITGNIMYAAYLNSGNHQLNLTHFASGIYILNIKDTNSQKNIRIIKQ